jgi:carboxypeptidase C (cathepsin A)
VEYTLAHMSVDPHVRAGITTERFEAGHMVYIDGPSMTRLREGLRKFIDGALPQAQRAQR